MITAIVISVIVGLGAGFALGATYGQAAERAALARASEVYHEAEALAEWVRTRVKGVL